MGINISSLTDPSKLATGGALTDSINNISSDATEEELKGVIKDFESYFVEQMLKEVKESITSEDENADSTASQYTDYFMDSAIELISNDLVDDVGKNLTQQLYEQMKRNYNL